MLNKEDFGSWCRQLGLPSVTVALIENIRSSQPVRAAHSSIGNVTGRFPSRKMGVTIQFESHKNELAFIREYEYERYEKEVLEFYDQPSTIKLAYKTLSGRRLGVLHTPDFFVIRREAAGWEECKTEEQLINLALKNPNRYFPNSDGSWQCLPGEAYAEQFGLYYRVRSSKEINWTYQRNIDFLEDFFRSNAPNVTANIRATLLEVTNTKPGISTVELNRDVDEATYDDIYVLISKDELYVDLHENLLIEPDTVQIFPNKETATAYKNFIRASLQRRSSELPFLNVVVGNYLQWDGRGWEIINVGETTIGLIGESQSFIQVPLTAFEKLVQEGRIIGLQGNAVSSAHPEAMRRLEQADRSAFAKANRLYEIVRASINGDPTLGNVTFSDRTLRRLKAKYFKAQEAYGCGYVGLLPIQGKGNTKSGLPDTTLTAINDFIVNKYETHKQQPKFAVYSTFRDFCLKHGVIPASYKTFIKAIKNRPHYEQTLKRQGRRAAYKDKEFYWSLTCTTPPHGEWPFHIAHIDHTELDVELVCSLTGQKLGRPWATLLVDAYSRRILAVILIYDKPSHRSCMMIIRECVRRFGRLPQVLVTDGGLEFSDTYFETLLAVYECTKKTRPPAESRFGSICERLFGTTNTRFIHNLQGNTQIMRNVRQVTKSVNPKEHAIWTLEKLYVYLREWAYEVYDTMAHPALSECPRDAFARGMFNKGSRSHRLIPNDNLFRILTLPATPKTTAKIQPGRGVKIKNIYYWSESFRHPEVEGERVRVRYDSFDAGLCFAYVRGKWTECYSERFKTFHNKSAHEIAIATAELRRRQTLHSGRFNITALQLARFLESVEGEEILLRQRMADRATRNILTLVDGKQQLELTAGTKAASATEASKNPDLSHTVPTDKSQETIDPELYGEF
jgi:putative transposase